MLRTLVDVLAAASWRMGALLGRPPFPYPGPRTGDTRSGSGRSTGAPTRR
jgi:hypothetical protein